MTTSKYHSLVDSHQVVVSYAWETCFNQDGTKREPGFLLLLTAVCAGAVLGSACGIAAWLAYARLGFGEVTIATTGQNLPLLTGNVVSLGLSLLITVAGGLICPGKHFDWTDLNRITKTEDTVSPPSPCVLPSNSQYLRIYSAQCPTQKRVMWADAASCI